jgi:hypothetical protein
MIGYIIKAALVPVYKAQRLCRSCRFLFVIAHARSGSTLLSHILSSNPGITGYGETYLRYRSSRDLDRLIVTTSIIHRRVLVRRYTMDKIVYNGILGEAMLRDEDCRFIFLIREPERAIPSYIRQQTESHPNRGLEEVISSCVDHFDSRIRTLVQEASGIDDLRRKAFLTYDQLINRTVESLQMLQDFLELDTPLSEYYSITKKTGEVGIGDASPFIRKGYIDRLIEHEPVPIDHEIIDRETELYESVRARLSSSCRSLPRTTSESPEAAPAITSNGHTECRSSEDVLVNAFSPAD